MYAPRRTWKDVFSNNRLLTVAVLLGFGCALGWLACRPTDGGPGPSSVPLSLSASSARPGQFIEISHPSIKSDEPVHVTFRQLDGVEMEFEATFTDDGSARVPVPPLIDAVLDTFSDGMLSVSIAGVSGERTLEVDSLPDLGDLPPGTVFDMALQSSIEDYLATESLLLEGAGEIGTVSEVGVALTQIQEERQRLTDLRSELEQIGTIRVPVSDFGTVALTTVQLREADRYLAAMIRGLAEEAAFQDGLTSGKMLPVQQTACPGWDNLSVPPVGAEIAACINQGIEDTKEAARRGLRMAAGYGAAVGASFTVLGATAQSGAAALQQAVVAAVNAAASTASALVAKENVDAFKNSAAEKFDETQHALKEMGTYAVNTLSNLPGYLGAFFGTADVLIAVGPMSDGLEAARCGEKSSNNRLMQSLPSGSFCVFLGHDDPPAGNDNSATNGNDNSTSGGNDNSEPGNYEMACPGAGDCCESNGSPGCSDAACCAAVCAGSSFCCEVTWDFLCAGIAAASFSSVCSCGGSPFDAACPVAATGDCCENNGTPGCDDAICCVAICADDDFCCSSTWDSGCAQAAEGNVACLCD